MGPLINAKQHAPGPRLHARSASEEGAELVIGGGKPAGERVRARVLRRADALRPGRARTCASPRRRSSARCCRCMPVDDEDEALEVANGTEYGLVASVWTARRRAGGPDGAKALQAGQVAVNAALGAASSARRSAATSAAGSAGPWAPTPCWTTPRSRRCRSVARVDSPAPQPPGPPPATGCGCGSSWSRGTAPHTRRFWRSRGRPTTRAFDAFFRSDHLFGVDPNDPTYRPTDCWTTLAGLARDTSRIRLGSLVTAATFRRPGLLATIVANVDEMSGGRIELGLGTGWYQREHEAFGIPFPATGERFDRLAEQLEIITGLWHTEPGAGTAFSFTGKHYRVEANHNPPRPAQRPHPPIIVGGTGPKRTPAIAARFADEFNGALQRRSARELRAVRSGLRADRARPGRGPPFGRAPGGVRDHAGRGDPARRGDRLGADPPPRRDRLAGSGRRPRRGSVQGRRGHDLLPHLRHRGPGPCRAARRGSPARDGGPTVETDRRDTHPRRDRTRAAHAAGSSPSCGSIHRERTRSGSGSTRPGCATPTTTSPRATRWCACRWSAGTRAPAWSSRSARTCAGSSPATGWSAPTSRPAASAGPARPGTRTCATRARTPGPACSPTALPLPRRAGEDLGGFCTLGTFSQYAVVSEWACIKLPDDIPFEVGSPGRLRGAHRLGLGGVRGRGAGRGHRGDLRRRRGGQQRGAGRAVRRREERRRGRPGGVQAGHGQGLRGDARVRRREGGARLRGRDHPGPARRPRDLHAGGAHRGDSHRGGAGDRQGRQGDDHRGRARPRRRRSTCTPVC